MDLENNMTNNAAMFSQMIYSFSSVTSHGTCPLSFKYGYIDGEKGVGNFFADYGLFIHDIFQKYFKYELSEFDLSSYYSDNFDKEVTETPPPFPAGMLGKYKESGQVLFDNFEFDREDYELIVVEEKVTTSLNGIPVVVKPDIVLRNKKTGQVILLDFKTSNPYVKDRIDKKKLAGYLRQMYLYAYVWNSCKEEKITDIYLWFVRIGKIEKFTYTAGDEKETLEWFNAQIKEILSDEEWKAIPDNTYFCGQICGFRKICPYAPKYEPPVKEEPQEEENPFDKNQVM
jgi:hypothetical protein